MQACLRTGGVLTTATGRDATHWDDIVKRLGLEDLTRHGLRHTPPDCPTNPAHPLSTRPSRLNTHWPHPP